MKVVTPPTPGRRQVFEEDDPDHHDVNAERASNPTPCSAFKAMAWFGRHHVLHGNERQDRWRKLLQIVANRRSARHSAA